MAGRRADGGEYAERVNAAVELLRGQMVAADAIRVVAQRFGVSPRQARRYVDRAGSGGLVAAPAATTAFTVKLPAELVGRVREQARASGGTLSALVAQALEEFVSRGHRRRSGR
jgi:hypothetical protein